MRTMSVPKSAIFSTNPKDPCSINNFLTTFVRQTHFFYYKKYLQVRVNLQQNMSNNVTFFITQVLFYPTL